MVKVCFAPSDMGVENSSVTLSLLFEAFVVRVCAPSRALVAPAGAFSDFNSSLPYTQWTESVRPLRLMVPKPEVVTHGARKFPGALGMISKLWLCALGLKPVAASSVAQLLMGRV